MLKTLENKNEKDQNSLLLTVVHSIGWTMIATWLLVALPVFETMFGFHINGIGTYHAGQVSWLQGKIVVDANIYFAIVFIGVLYAKAGLLLTTLQASSLQK